MNEVCGKMGKLWARVLVFALCIQMMLPMGAIAEEKLDDWAYSTQDGEVTLNYYLGGQGELTLFQADGATLFIPAQMDGKPVTRLSDYLLDFIVGEARFEVEPGSTAFASKDGALLSADGETLIALNRDAKGSYVVPDSVKLIGNNAFRGCAMLEQISVPEGVTEVGNWAFEGCTQLLGVSLPGSLVALGYGAFARCESLAEIELTGSIPEIGERAFYGCTQLMRIRIPESVVLISREAFLDCGNLDEVQFSQGLTAIDERAFDGCDGLSTLSLPDGLKSIGDFAFYHCRNLRQIDVPKSVTSIGDGAFKDCDSRLVVRGARGSKAEEAALLVDIAFEGM